MVLAIGDDDDVGRVCAVAWRDVVFNVIVVAVVWSRSYRRGRGLLRDLFVYHAACRRVHPCVSISIHRAATATATAIASSRSVSTRARVRSAKYARLCSRRGHERLIDQILYTVLHAGVVVLSFCGRTPLNDVPRVQKTAPAKRRRFSLEKFYSIRLAGSAAAAAVVSATFRQCTRVSDLDEKRNSKRTASARMTGKPTGAQAQLHYASCA